MRIDPTKTQKEPTYQVVLDALALTTCYPAFLITADVLKIYMHQFWFTINKHDSSYRFKIDKKMFTLNMEVFKEIFQICSRLPNQEFVELPSDEEIVSFIKELGHKGDIKSITELVVDQMYQPWRTFASIINKCLFGKIIEDDSILGTMRFVSKSDEYLVYGALLPKRMTNQKIWDSHAYKMYLSFATEEEEPETAKKVVPPKKPSRKHSTGVQIRDNLGMSMLKKKSPTKAARSKGIDLLSEAALLEEAQLKKDLKRNKQETSIHQAGGSSEGANFELEVLDQPKGKSIDTSEGIGLKPRVPNGSKCNSSESKYESLGDSGDEANNQETNDDEEEINDEFVHAPPNYVPTDDETNDESNDVDEEEYDRIDKELYGDVNVKQTQEQTTCVQEESGPKMTSIQGQYVVHATTTTTPSIQNATTDVPPFSSSHSISSNYTSSFLNLKNLHSTEPEVVSMMYINVQHEVPHTLPLFTILVSVIPEHTIFNPSKTVTTASVTTIIADLEKDVKELKDVDNSTKVILTIKFEVPNAVKEYLRSSLDYALHMVIQRNFADIIKEHPITDETIERLRQQYASKKSILEDKDAMEKGIANELKKKKPYDADKDEGPSAGLDRGLKRQRTSKETKTSKKASTIKDSSKVKSPATSSKSSKSSKSAKDQVVEQIFIQDSNNAEHDDAELNYADMLIDQGNKLNPKVLRSLRISQVER
ncbi:hypothetical protein Tco_0006722 [Tanacetum coccineum]